MFRPNTVIYIRKEEIEKCVTASICGRYLNPFWLRNPSYQDKWGERLRNSIKAVKCKERFRFFDVECRMQEATRPACSSARDPHSPNVSCLLQTFEFSVGTAAVLMNFFSCREHCSRKWSLCDYPVWDSTGINYRPGPRVLCKALAANRYRKRDVNSGLEVALCSVFVTFSPPQKCTVSVLSHSESSCAWHTWYVLKKRRYFQSIIGHHWMS